MLAALTLPAELTDDAGFIEEITQRGEHMIQVTRVCALVVNRKLARVSLVARIMEFAAPFFDHRELTMFLDDFSFERERGDDAYAFADRLEWETTERVPTTVQTLTFSYVRKAPKMLI